MATGAQATGETAYEALKSGGLVNISGEDREALYRCSLPMV